MTTDPWPDPFTAKVIVVLVVATVITTVRAVRADFAMRRRANLMSVATLLVVLGFAWVALHRVVAVALSDTPWAGH